MTNECCWARVLVDRGAQHANDDIIIAGLKIIPSGKRLLFSMSNWPKYNNEIKIEMTILY